MLYSVFPLMLEEQFSPAYLTLRQLVLPLSALLLLSQMAIPLETNNSREDMMTTAARLSEALGNLPPLSSISYRYSAPGVATPTAARPSRFSNTCSSRCKTTASQAPMAEVPTAIGCSTEGKVEACKQSLSRRRSILEGGHNSIDVEVETCSGVRLPVVKRRRIPVCARSTWAASAVTTGR